MIDNLPPPLAKDQDIKSLLAGFRHNLRNKLSPAVMVADHLAHHHDENVRHEAQMILDSLEATLAIIREIQISQ